MERNGEQAPPPIPPSLQPPEYLRFRRYLFLTALNPFLPNVQIKLFFLFVLHSKHDGKGKLTQSLTKCSCVGGGRHSRTQSGEDAC